MTIDELANKVCRELPPGYLLEVSLERNAGRVDLTYNEGVDLAFHSEPGDDEGLQKAVLDALQHAKQEWAKA